MDNPGQDHGREQHTTVIFLPEENDNDDDDELTDLTIPNPLESDEDEDESLETEIENFNQNLIDRLNIKVESAELSSELDAAVEPASVDDVCEPKAVDDICEPLSVDEFFEHTSVDEVFEPVSVNGAFNQAYKRFSVDKAYKPECVNQVLKPASSTIATQLKTTEECNSVTKEVNRRIKLNLKKPDFTINGNNIDNIPKWTPKIPTTVSTPFTKLLSVNSVGGAFIQNHGLLRGRILPPGSINIPKSVSSSNIKFFHKPVLTGVFPNPSNQLSQNFIGKFSPPKHILPKGWNPETLRSQTVIPIGTLHNPAKNQTRAYLNPPASNRCKSCENCKYPQCLPGHFCLAQKELNRYIQTAFCCYKPCLNPPIVQGFPQIDKVFSQGLEELFPVNPGKHVLSANTPFIQLNPTLSRLPVNPSSTTSSVMPVNHSVINNPNNSKLNRYPISNQSPSTSQTIYKYMPSSLASIDGSKLVGSLSLPDQQANVNPKSCHVFQSNKSLITSNLNINSKCTKPKHPFPLQLPSCSDKSANGSFVNPPCSRKNPLQILHSNRRIEFASKSFSDNLPIDEAALDDEILKLEQSLTSELSRTLNLPRFRKKIINKSKSVFNHLPKSTEENSDLHDLFYTEIALSKDHLQTGQDDTNLLKLNDHKLDMNHTVNEIINDMISDAVEHYSSKFDPYEDQSSQINLLCTETPLDSPEVLSPLAEHNNSNNHKYNEDTEASRLNNESSVSRSEKTKSPCKIVASEIKELLRITDLAKEVLKKNEVRLSTKVTFKTKQELEFFFNESRWIRRTPHSKLKHFRRIAFKQILGAQKEKIKHLTKNKNQTLDDEEGNQLFFMDYERIAQLKPIRLESTLKTSYPGTYQQEESTHKLKPKVIHSPNLSIKVKKDMLFGVPDPTSEKDQSAVGFRKRTYARYVVLGNDQNRPREQGNNPGCLQAQGNTLGYLQAQGNTPKHLQAKGNTHGCLQEPVIKSEKSPVLVKTVPKILHEESVKINRPKSTSKENVAPLIPDPENQCPSALMDHCISTVINKGIAVSQFFETQMETKIKKNTSWTVKLISRKERLPHLEDHTYYKPFGIMVEEMMNVDLTDYALDPLLIEGQEGMENEHTYIYIGTEEDDISGTFNLVDDNAIENMKSANCESSKEEEEAEDFCNADEADSLTIIEEHLDEYSGVRQRRKRKKSEDEDYIPSSYIQISGCSNEKFISTRNMPEQQKPPLIAKEKNEREIREEDESIKEGRKGGPFKSKKFFNKDKKVVLLRKIKQQREAYEQFWRDKDPNRKDRVQLLEDCATDQPRRDNIPSRNDNDLSRRDEVLYRKERKHEKKKRPRSPSTEIEENSEYKFMKEVDGVPVDYRCFWCKVLPRKGAANKSELYRHYTIAHFTNELKEKVGHFTSCPICRKDFSKGGSSSAVSHMGQVHSYVEAFLPQEAWIPEGRGVKRKRDPVSKKLNSPLENLKTEERKDRKVEEDVGKNKEEKTAENEKSVTKKVSGKQDQTFTKLEQIPYLRSSAQKLRVNCLDKKPRLVSSKPNSQSDSSDQKPLAALTEQKPRSDSSDQNLLLDSTDQKPQSDSSDQKSQSGLLDQKPQSDSSDQKSQSDLLEQKYFSDLSDQNLQSDSLYQNPLAASTEQKPQSDFSDQKPQSDSTEQNPPSDSSDQKLALYLSEQITRSDSADQKTQSDLSDQKSPSDSSDQKSLSDSSDQKSLSDSSDQKSLSDSSDQKSLTDSTDQKPHSDSPEQKTQSISPEQNRGMVAIEGSRTASNFATIAGKSDNCEEDNPKIEVFKTKYDYDDYDELLDSD